MKYASRKNFRNGIIETKIGFTVRLTFQNTETPEAQIKRKERKKEKKERLLLFRKQTSLLFPSARENARFSPVNK